MAKTFQQSRAPPLIITSLDALLCTMSAISANSAVFARKALAGQSVAAKRQAVKSKAAFSVSANARVDACDKNSVIVSPSILSANFATLGAEVRGGIDTRIQRDHAALH
jgi:hypothetical protein